MRGRSERGALVIWVLKLAGLWFSVPDSAHGKLLSAFQVFRVVQHFVSWCLCAYQVFTQGVLFLLSVNASFLPIMAVVTEFAVYIFINHQFIEEALLESDFLLSRYIENGHQGAREAIQKHDNIFKKLVDNLLVVMIGFIFIYNVGPPLYDIALGMMGREEPYVLPLPLGGYLDQPDKRDLKHYIIIIYCLLWFVSAAPNGVAVNLVVPYAVLAQASIINVLKIELRSLVVREELDRDVGLMDRAWNLSRPIEIHQNIIRLNSRLNKAFGAPVIYWRVINTVSICFLMFLSSQMVAKDTVVAAFAATFMLIVTFLSLFICLAAEYLQTVSTELFYEMSNLPWYRQPPRQRRDLALMLCQANRTLSYNYRQTFKLSMESFVQIVQTAFSYYTIMKTVMNKK